MAIQLKRFAQVEPAAAVVRRGTDSLHDIGFAFFPFDGVQRVGLGAFAEPGEGVARGSAKRDFLALAGDQNQSPAALRHSIIGGIKHVVVDLITQFCQFSAQCFEPVVLRQLRNIFHHHRLGTEHPDEPKKLENQIVPLVLSNAAVQRSHGGEPLARRTTGEQIKLSAFDFQVTHDGRHGNFPDVLLPDENIFVVGRVGFDRERINLDRTDDPEASLCKPQREATASGEEVYGFGLLHAAMVATTTRTTQQVFDSSPWTLSRSLLAGEKIPGVGPFTRK